MSSLASPAFAADAGSDSGSECRDSRDCAPPSPYCRDGRCIECLSGRNCASGVCDVAAGACRECLSDADCGAGKPYCDVAHGTCVECVSTENCREFGVACLNGACGACGDGVCSKKEAIYVEESYGPFGPISSTSEKIACPADCASVCPTSHGGTGLGEWTVPTAGLPDLFSFGCANPDGPDVSFVWKAEKAGNYNFEGILQGPDAGSSAQTWTAIMPMAGGCSGSGNGCASGGAFQVQVAAGDEVVLVLDLGAATAPNVTLRVTDAPPCSGLFCSPGGGGGGGDGGSHGSKDTCLSRASERGDEMCGGVECACEHCAQDYDDAAVVPGAGEIRACMAEKGCVGADCYNSGACRRAIDTNGGVSGAAFRAAAGLQSCALTYRCDVPCPREGGVHGSSDGGVPDAGRLCAPGRVVTCTCEDGAVGDKTCDASGSAFGACSCGAEPAKPKASGGCSCDVARSGSPGGTGVASASLALCVMLRRRRVRAGRESVR
ncbi:MAG TPA: hypothetical protein VHE30_20745 [Polyangiaceae bacterium]|nr:hypothetical protein [Polyangiaceae bacterium]